MRVYTRRRVSCAWGERDFVRSGEVLRETREEVAKSGEVLRESRLVFFEWSGGGNENQLVLLGCALSFLCSTLAF